jgi:hypothetical protein
VQGIALGQPALVAFLGFSSLRPLVDCSLSVLEILLEIQVKPKLPRTRQILAG